MGQLILEGSHREGKRDLGGKMGEEKMAKAGKSLDAPALRHVEEWIELGRKKAQGDKRTFPRGLEPVNCNGSKFGN